MLFLFGSTLGKSTLPLRIYGLTVLTKPELKSIWMVGLGHGVKCKLDN